MRRLGAALRAIIATIINVITLPFRVIDRLLGSSRGASPGPADALPY